MDSADQARLRLATVDGIAVDPRKYAQSTSGRSDSHGTAPPLSRSSAITSDSPSCGFVDRALRRYPMVVLQRPANRVCSETESELRYARSDSIEQRYLPLGTVLSSTPGNLPRRHADYPWAMPSKAQENARLYGIRRRKLALLVSEVGTQSLLAQQLASSHLRVLSDVSYISRALSGKTRQEGGKNIGGDAAAEIERIMGKPPGWMSRDEGEPALLIDDTIWNQLTVAQREALTTTVNAMVQGFLPEHRRKSRKAG